MHPDYSIAEIGQYTQKSHGCHSDSWEKPLTNAGKKLTSSKIIRIAVIIINILKVIDTKVAPPLLDTRDHSWSRPKKNLKNGPESTRFYSNE